MGKQYEQAGKNVPPFVRILCPSAFAVMHYTDQHNPDSIDKAVDGNSYTGLAADSLSNWRIVC
jgi:hypothetical protein